MKRATERQLILDLNNLKFQVGKLLEKYDLCEQCRRADPEDPAEGVAWCESCGQRLCVDHVALFCDDGEFCKACVKPVPAVLLRRRKGHPQ